MIRRAWARSRSVYSAKSFSCSSSISLYAAGRISALADLVRLRALRRRRRDARDDELRALRHARAVGVGGGGVAEHGPEGAVEDRWSVRFEQSTARSAR